MKNKLYYFLPTLFGTALLLSWELIILIFQIPIYIMPAPSDILISLWQNHVNLLESLFITIKVTLTALTLASVSGAGLAIFLVQSKVIERTFFPYAIFLQVTPIVTIAPFIIIWVDDIFLVLLILAWMAAVFPIISNTLLGLKSVDPNLHDLFKLYNSSKLQVLRFLLLPNALPYFLGGLRISGGLALIGTVVAEMVAGTSGQDSGIASRLLEASYRLDLAKALACFILLSITGYMIYFGLDLLSKKALVKWHYSAQPEIK